MRQCGNKRFSIFLCQGVTRHLLSLPVHLLAHVFLSCWELIGAESIVGSEDNMGSVGRFMNPGYYIYLVFADST